MRRQFKREGTYVYPWLIHFAIRQKSTQYCKAIILQLKINVLKIIFLKNYKFLYLKTIDCFVCPDGVF